MLTTVIFLIVLAVLIFVHELGHFLFAKMFGIRVDAFKIGFGPKIFAWTPKKKDGTKGETEYGLNLIPFGGYVKIFGENPDAESTHGYDSKRSMIHKPRWQQAIILIGGVLFNVLFAFILYVGLFSHGVTATSDGFSKYERYFSNPRIMITDVLKGSPASTAGLETGDVIVEVYKPASVKSSDVVNKSASKTISVTDSSLTIHNIQSLINANNGSEIVLSYIRGGQEGSVHVLPQMSAAVLSVASSTLPEQRYLVGIAMNDVVDMKLPFFTAVYEGGHYTLNMLKETVVGLYGFIAQIFQGTANFSDISGPVGIAGVVGGAAHLGFTYLLMITALISINLAVINLFPFPALDGGRILFVLIESVTRRRISPTFANSVNLIGFSLLMLLMVVVTYKDIVKLI